MLLNYFKKMLKLYDKLVYKQIVLITVPPYKYTTAIIQYLFEQILDQKITF